MTTIDELIHLPMNTLVNPAHVLDAFASFSKLVSINLENCGEGRGFEIWWDFLGFDYSGQPIFDQVEYIPFTYQGFSEFVVVGELADVIAYLEDNA